MDKSKKQNKRAQRQMKQRYNKLCNQHVLHQDIMPVVLKLNVYLEVDLTNFAFVSTSWNIIINKHYTKIKYVKIVFKNNKYKSTLNCYTFHVNNVNDIYKIHGSCWSYKTFTNKQLNNKQLNTNTLYRICDQCHQGSEVFNESLITLCNTCFKLMDDNSQLAKYNCWGKVIQ